MRAPAIATGAAFSALKALDHDGRRTGRTLDVKETRFTIDGAKDKAIDYEVLSR